MHPIHLIPGVIRRATNTPTTARTSAATARSRDGTSGTKRLRWDSFRRNAFGLYDMHGNVLEWVEDPWHDTYRGTPPTDGSTWTEGGDPNRRILRGGCGIDDPVGLRSADRRVVAIGYRYDGVGFRIGRTLSP